VGSKKKAKRQIDETSESAPIVPEWQRRRPKAASSKATGPRFSPMNAAEGDSAAPSFPENYLG
jgi:hypothetical protein